MIDVDVVKISVPAWCPNTERFFIRHSNSNTTTLHVEQVWEDTLLLTSVERSNSSYWFWLASTVRPGHYYKMSCTDLFVAVMTGALTGQRIKGMFRIKRYGSAVCVGLNGVTYNFRDYEL